LEPGQVEEKIRKIMTQYNPAGWPGKIPVKNPVATR
jgi:hypothetical protein